LFLVFLGLILYYLIILSCFKCAIAFLAGGVGCSMKYSFKIYFHKKEIL